MVPNKSSRNSRVVAANGVVLSVVICHGPEEVLGDTWKELIEEGRKGPSAVNVTVV